MRSDKELSSLITELSLKRCECLDRRAYISIVVEGDCNDGDYETGITTFDLDDDEDVDLLKESIKFIIANRKRLYRRCAILDNYKLREEILEKEYFELPRDCDDVCHTITSIEFKYTDRSGSSYDLELI